MVNKKAQEEMIGFALIVIIVGVIMLVFLGFSLNSSKNQNIQSYEAESFVQSALQYTTTCEDYYGYLSVKDLIFMCDSGTLCLDDKDSCVILNSTLSDLLNSGWSVGKSHPIKGYLLNINSSTGISISLSKGNFTGDSKGAVQDFSKEGNYVNIQFRIYS